MNRGEEEEREWERSEERGEEEEREWERSGGRGEGVKEEWREGRRKRGSGRGGVDGGEEEKRE